MNNDKRYRNESTGYVKEKKTMEMKVIWLCLKII